MGFIKKIRDIGAFNMTQRGNYDDALKEISKYGEVPDSEIKSVHIKAGRAVITTKDGKTIVIER